MNNLVRAHIYLDDQFLTIRTLAQCFQLGETVRVRPDKYALVTEVVWCLDEAWDSGQRVNIRLESEKDE